MAKRLQVGITHVSYGSYFPRLGNRPRALSVGRDFGPLDRTQPHAYGLSRANLEKRLQQIFGLPEVWKPPNPAKVIQARRLAALRLGVQVSDLRGGQFQPFEGTPKKCARLVENSAICSAKLFSSGRPLTICRVRNQSTSSGALALRLPR